MLWLLMLMLPAAAAAQEEEEDQVVFKGNQPARKGRVRTVSCKSVALQLPKVPQPQNFDRDEIADIKFDPNNVPTQYASGLNSLERGDNDKAISYFKSAIQSAGTPWVAQFAYFQIAETYRSMGRMDEWEKTLNELKTKIPDTYFLYDIYNAVAEHHTAAGNPVKAEAALKEMETHAAEHGHESWGRAGKFLRAKVEFAQGKHADALKNVRGIPAADPLVGLEAQVLELRILTDMKSFDEARAKARPISEGKNDPRLMAAAFNALGDCERNAGRLKDAMMHYLRGVAEFDVIPSPEHEYSLAMSAIAMAEHAKSSSNPDIKELYLGRAHRHFNELVSGYGTSKLSKTVETALK